MTNATDEVVRVRILERQKREWPLHLKGAALGNPYATMCHACFGRHGPPLDEICPRSNLNTTGASNDR